MKTRDAETLPRVSAGTRDTRPDSMTSSFHIEKRRLPVAVTLVNGTRIAGDIFVQPLARHGLGPEEASDLLNDRDAFFPVVTESDDTLLIAKEHVAHVEAEMPRHDEQHLRALGHSPAAVEVTLYNGDVHAGQVFLALPLVGPRLLEFLNHHTERFLVLQGSDGGRLVNRKHIAHVRPLD